MLLFGVVASYRFRQPLNRSLAFSFRPAHNRGTNMKSRMTSIRRFTLLIIPCAALMAYVMATARPVHATFPGTNGRIAFNQDFGDAFTINPDGSQEHQVGPAGGTRCTTWSPDGSKIACNVFSDNGREP